MGTSNEMARAMAAGLQAPQLGGMYQASQGLLAGIKGFQEQQENTAKKKQMYEADKYVSSLLGKGDIDSITQARTMLPYANEQYAKQAQYMVDDLRRAEDVKWRGDRATIDDAFKTGEFIQKDEHFTKEMSQRAMLERERNSLQLKLTQMQESGANSRAQLSARTQLAGINRQIKAQEMQMARLDKQAEIATRAANIKFKRSLVDTIDPIKSAEMSMSRHGIPDFMLNTSDFINNSTRAKELLGHLSADESVSADDLAAYVNMVNSGRSLDLINMFTKKK